MCILLCCISFVRTYVSVCILLCCISLCTYMLVHVLCSTDAVVIDNMLLYYSNVSNADWICHSVTGCHGISR